MHWGNWPLSQKQQLLDRAKQRVKAAIASIVATRRTLPADEDSVYLLVTCFRYASRPIPVRNSAALTANEESGIRIDNVAANLEPHIDVVMRLWDENRIPLILESLEGRGLISADSSATFLDMLAETLNEEA